jgi:hypothetical protein
MLLRVFKSNEKLINGLILLLPIFLALPFFFKSEQIDLLLVLSTGFKGLDISLVILLIAFQAIYLNSIVNSYKLVADNSHLTSLMFVVLNCSFLELFNLNLVLIGNTFVLLGIHQLLRLYDRKGGFALLFNAGFFISVALVIYFPNVVFLLFLWTGVLYMMSAKWRDFVITLIGFSVPIAYLLSYKFVVGDLSFFELGVDGIAIFNFSWGQLSVLGKILLSCILLTVFMAFMRVASSMNRGTIRTRKMFVIIFLMCLFGLLTLSLNGVDYLATFIVLTVPLSILMAKFFQQIKKQWLGELLFMTLLFLLIGNYFS